MNQDNDVRDMVGKSLKTENETFTMPYFLNPKKISPMNIIKPAGNMVVLKCKASGYPTPNITWLKDNEKPSRYLGDIRYNNWSLQIQDLIVSDTGNYTCIVCNEVGCINHTYKIEVVGMYCTN